jgi:hypothetical protein
MPSNQPPEESDQRLDRLLDQARWPEPTEDQLARLRGQWRELNRELNQQRPRRTYLRVAGMAAAASLLVVAGTLAWRGAQRAEDPAAIPQAVVPEVAVPQIAKPQGSNPLDEGSPRIVLNEQPGARGGLSPHNPTLYEQVLLAGSFPAPKAASRTNEPRQRQIVRRPLPAMAKEPHSRVAVTQKSPGASRVATTANREFAALAAVVGEINKSLSNPARCEPLLWKAIREQTGLSRTGAVELLALVATERSLPMLAELANSPDTHDAAIHGLARLAPAADVAYLAARETGPELRRELCAALVARRTEQSVRFYLELVARPELRRDALDALADAQPLPGELLLTFLRSSDGRSRLAAAQALGRVDDPAIVDALRQSLAENGNRHDALVALLLNPTPQAAAVVNAARADLYLVATVRAAEIELHQLADFPKR